MIETRARAPYTVHSPTTIHVGAGVVGRLSDVVAERNARRVAIVSDPGVEAAGIDDRVRALLSGAGCDVTTFSDVEPDPAFETIDRALDCLRSFDADLVVGVGGGSSLDAGKVVAALLDADDGGTARDFVGTNRLPGKGRPYVALPTTAGTGSEVTGIVILSDHADHLKKGLVSPHLVPDVALVDFELTYSLPPRPTATSGMDALTHAIEAFTSVRAHAVSDALARAAVLRIETHLEAAVSDATHAPARAAMMEAALMAGVSFASAGVAAVHAMAYPLGGRFDVAHGLANAVLLPAVMRYNQPTCEAQYARLGREVGLRTGSDASDATAFVDRVAALAAAVDLAVPLRDLGVTADDLPSMAREAHAIRRLMDNNPRDASPDDLHAIYAACL